MKRKSSKKNESSKYNLNIQNNDEMFLKFNETEIDGFQVFSPNVPAEEEEKNKFGKLINPFEIKNSEDFIKNWKTLEELEEAKEEKELFNELWDNIIKLNKSNILDYSLINELLRYLGNDESIQRFLFLIYALLDDCLDDYIKDENKFLIFQNNLIYFMIVLTNVKNNERFNYFFSKEKVEYLTLLLTKLEKIKNADTKTFFNNILFKLFTTEYIHLGLNLFLDNNNKDEDEGNINEIILIKDDENINNNNNINNHDSESNKILNNFYQRQKSIQTKEQANKEKYKVIVESLFDFESENFLNYKQDKDQDYSEIFFSYIELVKSIILILFSKEKYQFLKDEDEDVYYEYEFLDKLIKKNIWETKSIHEDKHKNLFRRDTISNNIIKYFFFLFGNHMIIESFMKPLNIILNITGLNNEFEIISFQGNSLNMERNITKDEFNILFDKILEKLNETIPFVFRIFLKMIYDNIIHEYPNLEKNDYSPISSLFFFSYLSNPRIQKIFGIYPDKYLFIKSVYRLIYNAAFNNKFNENDSLNIFNDDIEKYYKKITEFYENNIMNVDTNNEDNKKYLKNLFEEIGVEYPEFLFYLSCDYINDLNKNDENNKE